MLRSLGGVSVLVAGLALAPLSSGTALAATTVPGRSVTEPAAATCAFSPAKLVLGADAKSIAFSVPDVAEGATWRVQIPDLAVDSGPGHIVQHFDPKNYKNTDAGLHKATVTNGDTTCASTFRLLRPSLLTLVVVHNSPYRYVGGVALRTNYGTGPVRSPMSGSRIAIQFMTASGWQTQKVLTTSKKGLFIGKFKTGKHIWRAMLQTSSTTLGSVSKATAKESSVADA